MFKLRKPRLFLICALLFPSASQTNAQFEAPPRNYGFVVFNSNGIRVEPGRSVIYSFYVAAYLNRARLAGNIVAQGGAGNDIRVLVYKDQRVIFDSSQRRSVVLSIPITEPGYYTLALDNGFSTFSAKIASGYVNLLYDGIDTERARIERDKMTRRASIAQGVLDRLYVALQRDERELGTFQVLYKPRIVSRPDNELNASSLPQANVIIINRGTFELAEAHGSKQADILAGVIGHELAHIFYKHQRGNSSGISVWDELIGVRPIDRAQEREADVLGSRLACQAGFDPNGLLTFMQGLITRYGDRRSVGSDHPQTSERIGYIKEEVARCSYDRQRSSVGGSGSNLPSGRVAFPSSRYLTYSELGVLRVSLPDNWHRIRKDSLVWFVPEGAFGEVNGRSILTHGMILGAIQSQQQSLQQATDSLINNLVKSNPNSRPLSSSRPTYVAGRAALSIALNNVNEATGKPETINVVTTKLHNGLLLYVVLVSPEDEYRQYMRTFQVIIGTIKLDD